MKHETATSVSQQVSAAEWDVRVNLAAAYRLVALYGWDDLRIRVRDPSACSKRRTRI
jgi:hypothetical protein